MTPGLVSVIIPTYNRAHLVRRAVDSVLAQGYADVEVLVVDDGSKDDTREVVTRAYANEPRVRYLPKPNGGVSSARNLGIREARGEFVALLDSDDAWLPGKLALQLEALRRFPEAGMVWTDMAAVDEHGAVVHERYLRKMYHAYRYYPSSRELFARGLKEAVISGHDAFAGDIFSPMVLGNLVHTSTVLLRRERLGKIGFFNEKLKTGEDYPFHLKCCGLGPVAYVDAVTIHYTIGAADALSSPEKLRQVSLNFLGTLRSTLENERERITLPPGLIRERLADAYAWVGSEHLNAGMRKEALGFFARGLLEQPSRVALFKSLGQALLPAPWHARLSSLKRRLSGS